MEVLFKEYSVTASLTVGVHMYHTEYTAEQSGSVRNEIQTLQTTSSIVIEKQVIHIYIYNQ